MGTQDFLEREGDNVDHNVIATSSCTSSAVVILHNAHPQNLEHFQCHRGAIEVELLRSKGNLEAGTRPNMKMPKHRLSNVVSLDTAVADGA